MQWRSAALTGLALITVVCLLPAARPLHSSRGNQSKAGPVDSEPRDSGNLSSLCVYDPNPNHLWNRIFRQFYVRKAWDEREYGGDVLDPLLWGETHYLITGPSHRQALSVLDEFISTHGELLVSDPLKRAMLQRDLWSVFEWASDPVYVEWKRVSDSLSAEESRSDSAELERKLAQVMQRLALSPEQIQALPDTYSLAVAAKSFPAQYDPKGRETTFLPSGLFQPSSGWVNISVPDEGVPTGLPRGTGAPAHTSAFGARSLFLVFIRLPGGRDATMAYLKQLADFPKPCVPSSGQPYFLTLASPTNGAGVGDSAPVPNPDLPQFPRGTQVLLLRQMMLIDREGRLKPTKVVESAQIRVFVDIVSRAEWLAAPSKALQDIFELRLSRRKLFAGEAGGLNAVARDEREFSAIFPGEHFDMLGGEPDPNRGTLSDAANRAPVILSCAGCHGAPGVQSLAAARRLSGQGACTAAAKFYATSREEQAELTTDWKHSQYNWGLLQGFWLSNSD